MTATTRIVAAILVSLGVTATLAATGAFEEIRSMGHGLGHAAFCSRLTDAHVHGHAGELSSWAKDELALDSAQAQALEPVVQSLTEWATELRPLCDVPLGAAPSYVAVAVQFTDVSQRALTRFAALFEDWYATLSPEQRETVDGWMRHHPHGYHHRHGDLSRS